MLFTRSLGAKVQMLVVGTAVIVFAALFLTNSYWQRETTLHLIHDSSARTAQILLEAINDPMSKGNDEGTEENSTPSPRAIPPSACILPIFGVPSPIPPGTRSSASP